MRDEKDDPLLRSVTTVTFEEQDGRTRLTVHADAVGIAPVSRMMLAGMNEGWTQSIERLAALAARNMGGAA